MSGLRQAADEYLAMRRALGYTLATQGRILMSFTASMDAAGREVITTEAAVDWAAHPPRSTRPEWHVRRLEAVRLFARHRHALDPAHEVPAAGILPFLGLIAITGLRPREAYSLDDQDIDHSLTGEDDFAGHPVTNARGGAGRAAHRGLRCLRPGLDLPHMI
jgi:hypothetical protein